MIAFARSDRSLLARWWWTVDRWTLLTVVMLIGVGLILILAASPGMAARFNLSSFHFGLRQALFLVPALALLIGISLLEPIWIRRFAVLLLPAAALLMLVTLLLDIKMNGAARWIPLGPFTLQPSEFVKPAFAVVAAWLIATELRSPGFPGRKLVAAIYLLLVAMLLAQPDFGQAVLISVVWAAQIFIAGLPILWLAGLAAAGLAGITVAYFTMPHVASRIDRFIDPASGDTGQIDRALNAFRSGGVFGRGPGEGAVKQHLPDAHTDYIFAVAGEEFGAFACLAILAAFAVIVVRGMARLMHEEDPFAFLAVAGLLILFGLQAVINIGVNLALLPSKGMTLPFISYGGSSLLALAITMGMVLGLTRGNRFLSRSGGLAVRGARQ